MTTVNTTNFNIDQTARVYDQFYNFDITVPADEYDIVYSFFLREMTTPRAAGNFTVSLFRVAQETQIPVLTLLQGFQGSGASNGINLNVSLAYYLNMIRDRATLLGVGTPVIPNYYPAHAVLQ
jgi:pyruvate/2-oxoacid:ferredoxin oxidoreductase alpha subunit